MTDIGVLYHEARERITTLVRDADRDQLALVVPATPEWTVHDVVAHVVGIVEDALGGNMAGAPGPEWTAAQVARGRARRVGDLLDIWDEKGPVIEPILSAQPGLSAPVMDLHCHEQDLRAVLDRPGARDAAGIRWAVPNLLTAFGAKILAHELPAVEVRWEEGPTVCGAGEIGLTLDTNRFELFRAFFGRRSTGQISRMGWSGDAGPYLDALIIFGPSDADIVE